ncbi:Suppressor of cytokine signaling 7 [Paragonimus heterotremus]|uniref:Suppressor of cytokine signaling 7 n=1 Tax=Paragonimus heterotremus TaxID=100268 RepID=A0A8J4SQY2_9TREM|nr:Suppressor of cytokine signaling 7 [Paragonimus heterotremus]
MPLPSTPLTSFRSSSSLCCPFYCLQQQQQQQSHLGPGCTLHPILESLATGDVISVTGDGAVAPLHPSGSSDNSSRNLPTTHSQDPCPLTSSIPGRLTVANCVQPVASKSVLPVSEPISPRSQQRADDSTTSAVPFASPSSVERTLAPLPVRTSAIVTPVQSTRVIRTGRTLTSSIPFSATDLQQSRLSFQRSMLELRKMGWYWGPLTFQEAQVLLAKRPDGTFLVRDSGHDTYILSLSFRVRGETYHTRIEHSLGRFSFWSQPQSHSANTMVEFIEKAVAHSISGQFHYFLQSSAQGQPPVEVPLLYPLSRFQVVPSLRHLARFTILSCIRRDHINQLPLPHSLLNYLMEKQCYAESLEAFEEAIRDRGPLEFRPRQIVSSEPTADSLAIEQSLANTDETLPEVQRTTVSRRSTASNDSVASVDSQVTVRPTAVPATPSASC